MKTHSERRGLKPQSDNQSASLSSQPQGSVDKSANQVSSSQSNAFYVSVPVKDEKDKNLLEGYVSGVIDKKGFVNPKKLKTGSLKSYILIAGLGGLIGAGGVEYKAVNDFGQRAYTGISNFSLSDTMGYIKSGFFGLIRKSAKKALEVTDDKSGMNTNHSIDTVVSKNDYSPTVLETVNENYDSANDSFADTVSNQEIVIQPLNIHVDKDSIQIVNHYRSLINEARFAEARDYNSRFGRIKLTESDLSSFIFKYGGDDEFIKNVFINHRCNDGCFARSEVSSDLISQLKSKSAQYASEKIWK